MTYAQETPANPTSQIPEELQRAINVKSQALQEVNQKILQTQKELGETQQQSKSLQVEITSFDKNIQRLGLTIRSSEINVEKLNLEVRALQYEIQDTESKINDKKDAIQIILRTLQRKDGEGLLTTFLKSKSLAESLDEAQTIINLNAGLSSELDSLQSLNQQLFDKLSQSSGKKQKVELENKNLKYRKTIVESQKVDRQALLQQTKSQEKTYQNLIKDLAKQQDSIEEEIKGIEDELRAKFDVHLLPGKRPGVLAWPIEMNDRGGIGHVTQHFGERSYLYRGRPHNGLDIGAPIGTPVFAADDGRIIAVDNNDRSRVAKYQYGRYILIEHKNNFATIYAHLSSQVVKKGDVVKRGDLIGYVGKTGYATGPHLHFGLYWAASIEMKSIPPAAGLVPVGVVLTPEDYL